MKSLNRFQSVFLPNKDIGAGAQDAHWKSATVLLLETQQKRLLRIFCDDERLASASSLASPNFSINVTAMFFPASPILPQDKKGIALWTKGDGGEPPNAVHLRF